MDKKGSALSGKHKTGSFRTGIPQKTRRADAVPSPQGLDKEIRSEDVKEEKASDHEIKSEHSALNEEKLDEIASSEKTQAKSSNPMNQTFNSQFPMNSSAVGGKWA